MEQSLDVPRLCGTWLPRLAGIQNFLSAVRRGNRNVWTMAFLGKLINQILLDTRIDRAAYERLVWRGVEDTATN